MGAKTGNPATTTVSVAGVAVPAPTTNQCQKLSNQNEKDREKAATSPELTPSEQKAVSAGGSTIANFKFTPARGAAVTAAAGNRNEASSVDEDHFVKGGSDDNRKDKQSNLCIPYRYHGQGKRSSGHSESRIIETLFKKRPGLPRPGLLLISVDLMKKGTDRFGENIRSKMPCGHCHRLLCAAKKCGIKVFLCDKDNEPHELTDDMCEGNSGSRVRQSKRNKLKRVMGELPKR
jgi:hypothetical protein